jgi:hypothetical protein
MVLNSRHSSASEQSVKTAYYKEKSFIMQRRAVMMMAAADAVSAASKVNVC